MKPKGYRHGEILFVPVSSFPEGLEKADTDVIMNGSGGNDHKLVGGDIYFKNVDQFIFAYINAKKGHKLLHIEHGKLVKGSSLKECSLPVGLYEVRRQFENTNQGLKPIID